MLLLISPGVSIIAGSLRLTPIEFLVPLKFAGNGTDGLMERNWGSRTSLFPPVRPPANMTMPSVSVLSPVQLVPPFAAGTSIGLVLSKQPQVTEHEVQAVQEPQVQLTVHKV